MQLEASRWGLKMRRYLFNWPPLIVAVCLVSILVYCQALEQHLSDQQLIYHREQQILQQLEEISRLQEAKKDLEKVIRELEKVLRSSSIRILFSRRGPGQSLPR